ncbi:hypothetical protein Tco_1028613 [Tanacetum coccineum]|uniref:Uncharacterized protein n=1 Tax=Tanacetum coccineum TaxID=301880 RepID=A0ABQ5G2W3_9ASTR
MPLCSRFTQLQIWLVPELVLLKAPYKKRQSTRKRTQGPFSWGPDVGGEAAQTKLRLPNVKISETNDNKGQAALHMGVNGRKLLNWAGGVCIADKKFGSGGSVALKEAFAMMFGDKAIRSPEAHIFIQDCNDAVNDAHDKDPYQLTLMLPTADSTATSASAEARGRDMTLYFEAAGGAKSIQKSNGLATSEKEMETRETVNSVGSKKMTKSLRKESSRQDSQSQENVSPLLVLPQAIKCKLWHLKK